MNESLECGWVLFRRIIKREKYGYDIEPEQIFCVCGIKGPGAEVNVLDFVEPN